MQFAKIKCRKDVHDIQGKIAPVVNETVIKLESSKLIAIRLDEKQICCQFIPSDASNMSTFTDNKGTYLCYDIHNSTQKILLSPNSFINTQVQVIIPRFKVVIAGDLSFYDTATSSDGHSHVHCPYCDMTLSTWNDGISTGNAMTLFHAKSLCRCQ